MSEWTERNQDQKRVMADAKTLVDRLRSKALYGDANLVEALIFHAGDQLARAEAYASDGGVPAPFTLDLEVANGEPPKAPTGAKRGRPRKTGSRSPGAAVPNTSPGSGLSASNGAETTSPPPVVDGAAVGAVPAAPVTA